MQTLEAMLRPKVATLPGHIQAVYVQNAAKLFATVLKSQEGNTDSTAAQETSQLMIDRLPVFVQSANLEVQERVREMTSKRDTAKPNCSCLPLTLSRSQGWSP